MNGLLKAAHVAGSRRGAPAFVPYEWRARTYPHAIRRIEATAADLGMPPPSPEARDGEGFCQCGCGGRTPIATKTDRRYGRVKGKPVRFLNGHNGRRRGEGQ